MSLPVALALVLVSWASIFLVCVGWGALALRLAGSRGADAPDSRFWTGYALLLALLQLWHFFLPVDWRCTLALAGGGLLAGLRVRAFDFRAWPRPSRGALALGVCAGLWLALRALGPAGNYDSGLYHFASVRWANEYAIVPGLANLHDRLAFNQSHLLFVAWANHHPFFGGGHHVANSLLCLVLAAESARAIAALRSTTRPAMSDIAAALLAPALAWRLLDSDVSSPTPDLAVFVVGLVVFLRLLRLANTTGGGADANRNADIATLAALCAAGVSMKLSFAAFALATALATPFAAAPAGGWRPSPAAARRWAALLLAGACLWGIPFLVRGGLLSGYPLFPATVGAWPADWRLPLDETRATRDWIVSWARTPGLRPEQVLGSWAWLPGWWSRLFTRPLVLAPVLAGAAGLALTVGLLLRDAARRGELFPRRLACAFPLLAGGLFWFFTAPDPRFGDWLLWALAAWSLALIIAPDEDARTAGRHRSAAFAAAIGAATVAALHALFLFSFPRGFAPVPTAERREYVSRHGVRLWLPAGDDARLWDAPLPAAPLPRPNLAWRGPSPADGFRSLASEPGGAAVEQPREPAKRSGEPATP